MVRNVGKEGIAVWEYTSVVECLPSKNEVLSSIPNTHTRKKLSLHSEPIHNDTRIG